MVVALYFLPLAGARDPRALAEAVATFVQSSGLAVNRVTASSLKGKTRALRVSELAELCARDGMSRLTLWNKDVDTNSVHLHVRDWSGADESRLFFEQRHGHFISAALPMCLTDALRALLVAVLGQCRLANGFVAGFERYGDAMRECMSSGEPRDPDPAREERLTIDGRHYFEKDKLRRLYPITIIGPDIWAQLPPLPSFDPMPTVEDLGDCKLLTAWPTLCEPRDPDFLRGTRALRAWLWPYTIQNPADHVDNDPPVGTAAAH